MKTIMKGKKLIISSEVVVGWRKPRKAEVVDEEAYGDMAKDFKLFVKVEKLKGVMVFNGVEFIHLLRKGLITPIQ